MSLQVTHPNVIAELYRLRLEAHDEREVIRQQRDRGKKEKRPESRLAEYYAGLECAYMRAIVIIENADGLDTRVSNKSSSPEWGKGDGDAGS